MAIHKWNDIKNNMSPERQAKADDMVRKVSIKMNSFFGFHRFSPNSWQLRLGPLWIDRHDDRLTILWGSKLTIFDGSFWSKVKVTDELSPGSYEDSAFTEWTWKKGVGLVKRDECLIPSENVVTLSDRWKYVPGVGTVDAQTNEVFIPETPIPLTESEMEYGRQLGEKFKKESCCCSATYCATEETNISVKQEPTAKDIPDPSDKFPAYQKQYWYPGTNIWETWRKHFNLTKEEAEARWGKKLL